MSPVSVMSWRRCFANCDSSKPLDNLKKIGFVLQLAHSTRELENRPLSLRSSAALVSVELAQLWQHPSDGFNQSVRLL